MKTFTKIVVGAVIGAAILFTGYHMNPTSSVPQQQPGAVSGPDIQSPYYSVNGQVVFKYHNAFALNASTTCAVKSPNATSTLGFTANISSSSPSATIYELGTASDPFSTTTLIGTKMSIAAQALGSWVGSTTPASTGLVFISPNTWVNLKGGSPTVSPKGTCNYTFTVL